MTKSLERAIERLQQMPEDRQDLLAHFVLQEIEEEERWMGSATANADKLQLLVNDALEGPQLHLGAFP